MGEFDSDKGQKTTNAMDICDLACKYYIIQIFYFFIFLLYHMLDPRISFENKESKNILNIF